ncbi:MAG: NUDIX hydrolase [Nitrososphaerota archaeon]|nr:NUDIX hydrolase [Nitrososphaerota archaeon]MDG7047639.1 NUDIX hydrolase [Nitrososphaerota archaeon]
MKDPKKLSEELVYKSRVFSLYRSTYARANGGKVNMDIIRHKGAVAILPITEDGSIILEKQFRYALNSWLWEVPAGTIEDDEEPLECARRELREETGYEGTGFKKVGEVIPAPGYDDEKLVLFIVRVSGEPKAKKLDEDELIETSVITADKAVMMVLNGGIRDSKSVALITISRLRGYI